MAKRRRLGQKSLLILWVVILGIVVGLYLMRRQLFFASEALTPPPVGNVELRTENVEGGLTKVNILVRTGTGEDNLEAVSTIAFRLLVSGNENLKIVNENGATADSVMTGVDFSDEETWKIPVNLVSEDGNKEVIDLSAVNLDTDGFSTPGYKTLASFYVSGLGEGENLSFDFDEELSVMYSKRRPVTDIWEEN